MTALNQSTIYRIIGGLAGVLIMLLPAVSEAKVVYRSGETVSLSSEQIVEGNFYVTAGAASMSGDVAGDLYAVAGSMTLNGSVAEDVFAVAGTMQMHASVADDVRIIGGEVTIAEAVEGDLVVVAGVVNVLSTASIGGDVLLLSGEAEISGSVGGSIMGATERLRIDAPVGGDVDIRTAELLLGDRASVAGNVRYVSPNDLVRSPNAVVEGEVMKDTITENISNRDILQSILIPLFILLFAALTLFLFARGPVTILATMSRSRFWLKSLVGLLALVAMPVLASILFATVIGVLVGLFVLFAWLMLVVFALAMLPIVVGQWISYLATKQLSVSVMYIALGALAVEFALFIPFVGILAILFFLTATMGTILMLSYHALNQP